MRCAVVLMIFFLFSPVLAHAEMPQYTLTIKDHQFSPPALKVKANEKFKLIIDNQDATPEEFESHDLDREKVIGGGKKGTVLINALKPGTYKYVGEFHEDTAKGTIVAE